MPVIKKILYAADFSDMSVWALSYAAYLAERCGAELHCVHVVDDSYRYWVGFDLAAVPAPPPVEDLAAAAKRQMGNFLEDKIPSGVPLVEQILHGRPFAEVVRYAADLHMDLIVMGTHGRTGISHMLMGSVAEKVVRQSPCPVLTVRHPKQDQQ